MRTGNRRLHWSLTHWVVTNSKGRRLTLKFFYRGQTVERMARHIESLNGIIERLEREKYAETDRANQAEATLDAVRTDLAAR